MSLLLLFSGAGEDEEYGKSEGISAYEYRNLQARLHREDEEILEVIISAVLKDS